MDVFQAIILGTIQGITEFLPISSSGHLVLLPWIFGWEYNGVSFDTALHMGTLLGVVGYFWKEWKLMTIAVIRVFFKGAKRGSKGELARPGFLKLRLLFFIILATIPGAIAGYLLKDLAENVFRKPEIVAVMLIVFSFIIFTGEKFGSKVKDISHLNWQKALFMGLFQAMALVPGVSRSGATISAGLLLGLTRTEAAKFSFLLAAPLIFGAGLFKFPDILRQGVDLAFFAGVVSSAISGYFAIKFLFKFLEKASYMAFVWYRIILGLLIFGLIFAGK